MDTTDAPIGAQAFIPPEEGSVEELKAAAAGCKGCELHENATQTVFGRGGAHARPHTPGW